MKKFMLLTVIVIAAISLKGLEQEIVTRSINRVNVSINASRDSVEDEVISHTVALLAEDIEIVINNMEIGVYDLNGNKIDQYRGFDESRVTFSDQFIMRDMYGFSVNTEMIRKVDGNSSVIESLDYDIIGIGSREQPEEISPAFYEAYKNLAANFETSYLANLPLKQPAMLIISHNGLDNQVNHFARWKRARGIDITVINKETIGNNPNSTQIKNYITDYYNNAANKPDYLMLIGDVGGSYSLPTFYAVVANDATDLPYGIMSGSDYFPEILVGRISISSSYNLATIFNKTINYEKTPYMAETDWYMRGSAFAGNYATSLPIPITPVLMSRWLADLWYEVGYAEVDTVFWWPGDGGYGTTQIATYLNRGQQYVNYRGWGDANGWHYPQFYVSNLSQIQNGQMTPIVSSFVCNTGDFANQTINPCFGEYWMRMGTPTSTNGAVAFLGPSDLYTSTEFNNILSSGYHWGIQKEGIRNFAAALLRGKIQMYHNYPNDRGQGGWVQHYFMVYNILSDPSMDVKVHIPAEINVSLPETISQTTNYLEFSAPGLSGGFATVTRDEVDFNTVQIHDDHVFFPLDIDEVGDLLVTVYKADHIPHIQTIEVMAADGVGLIDYEFNFQDDNVPTPLSVTISLKNLGDTAVSNVTGTLSSNASEFVTIDEPTVSFGNIDSEEVVSADFGIEISPEIPRHSVIQFTLDVSPTEDHAKFQYITGGIVFELDNYTVDSSNGFLDPGETANIDVTISNIGEFDAPDVTAIVYPQTEAVTLTNNNIQFGDIAAGGTGVATMNVSAAADTYIGRLAYFILELTDGEGRIAEVMFSITIGEVTNTAPMGPDAYGYFAYDSHDTDYPQAPVYDWIDIDPNNGGPGSDQWLGDDDSMVMDLPFTFRYYGRAYDEVTICSNGWITFIPTWEKNFRNWRIPSPLAPKGIIAPFWDDLKGLDEVDNEVRVAWWHDETNNRFVISWLDAYSIANLTPSGLEKLQLILEPNDNDDGDIIFQYHTVWNQNITRNSSTTGIMNHARSTGLEYSYAGVHAPSATPLQAGLAIRFTTSSPDNYVSTETVTVPYTGLTLKQNYPNPFNPETRIEFFLPESEQTTLEIYNVMGQKIKTLFSGTLDAGNHSFIWQGEDNNNRSVGSGVYFYKISTPSESEVKRMLLLK
jgi:hypothetical protein